MKKIFFLTILTLSLFSTCLLAQEQFIIGGCGYNKIAVINKSGDILWDYKVDNSNCNDVEITKEGNILYSNGKGAFLINREKEIIWSYMAKKGEELYSSSQLKNGDYLLACCGTPTRIIELSKSGELMKELTYDTGIKRVHSQIRQISKTAKGHYIIPIMATGTIVELDHDGEEIRKIKVGKNLFQVNTSSKKQWLAAGADGHEYTAIKPSNGEILKKIGRDDIKECQLKFAGEIHALKNGNLVFANWLLHEKGRTEPVLAEIDSDNKLVWSIYTSKDIHSISSISPIQKKHQF